MKEETTQQTKGELRRRMKDTLRDTREEDRKQWSDAVYQHLTTHESWADSGGVVAIFGGMKYEPEILRLLPWLAGRGYAVALFGILGETMTPYRVHGVEDLIVGSLGVLEPRQSVESEVRVEDLGSVLVPGLAFGTDLGSRLGRGKGYYDRILGHPGFRGSPVGVAFQVQLLDSVPCEPHDILIPRLVTEVGWHLPPGRKGG